MLQYDMSNLKFAAILLIKDGTNDVGLLNLMQVNDDRDQIEVTRMETRWRSYFINDSIHVLRLKGNKAQFQKDWDNPTKDFLKDVLGRVDE